MISEAECRVRSHVSGTKRALLRRTNALTPPGHIPRIAGLYRPTPNRERAEIADTGHRAVCKTARCLFVRTDI